MGARSRQEGPPETPGLLGRTRRDDAAHNAPLHYRASRQGGAEALPKHEEGRVGRVGNGKIQEGFRRSPRYSQRPTKPGEGLSVNGRAAGRGRAQAEGSEPRGWARAPVTYSLRHAQEVSAS